MKLLSVPVSNAAKLRTATVQRCKLPGSTSHTPAYSAVPPCQPEACSVISPLSQKGKVVDVVLAVSNEPSTEVVASDVFGAEESIEAAFVL